MTPASNKQVTVEPPWRSFRRLTQLEYDRIVSAPTDEDRWFTPRNGWPAHVRYAGANPINVMPTATDDPGFFLPESEALGELRVEVLETDGLKAMDMVGFENDVYVVVAFEDSVAATRPIPDVMNPRFHNECARAFRFPIYSPHSSVHIGLFDSDEEEIVNSAFRNLTNSVEGLETNVNKLLQAVERCTGARNTSSQGLFRKGKAQAKREERRNRLMRNADEAIEMDDAIGRVVIDLRSMHPRTKYDVWYELRSSRTLDDIGRNGAVRLRYSLVWTAPERRRLAAYTAAPPLFCTHLESTALVEAVTYTLHGDEHDADLKFQLTRFKSHAREMKGMMMGALYSVKGGVTDLIMYEHAPSSVIACILWQLVMLFPRLLPSLGPLLLLRVLFWTYNQRRAELEEIQQVPSFLEHVAALLLPRAIYQLPCVPMTVHAKQYPPIKQSVVVKQRDARHKEAEKEEERALERETKFEEAYKKHLNAIALRENIAAGIDAVVGGAVVGTIDNVGQTVAATANTIGSSCGALMRGRCVAAAAGILTHAVRVVATTVAGAAKLGVNTIRGAVQTSKRTVEGAAASGINKVDPMQLAAAYLQPVQETLAYYLVPLRGMNGLLTWDDPALTSWLCLLLLHLAILMPFLPWLLILHGMGLLLLGPHMYLLGEGRRATARAASLEEARAQSVIARYSNATSDTARRQVLEEERIRREAQAVKEAAEEEKTLAALPYAKHAQYRRSYGDVVRVQGARVTTHKLEWRPDPMRSAAHAMRPREPDESSGSSVQMAD